MFRKSRNDVLIFLIGMTAVLTCGPVWGGGYREAPMLSKQVAEGKLPPLAKRLPDAPMVVQPAHEIGRYGGTWRRMMKGPSDFHAYGRCVYEQILRWTATADNSIQVGPGLAEGWEYRDGDRTLVLHFRKGLKWSDGHPFTTDDIVFWWERIARDRNLSGSIPRIWKPDGIPMELEQIDSLTVAFHDGKRWTSVTGLDKRGLKALRAEMQYVFQNPYGSLDPRMTVKDIVAEPLVINRLAKRSELSGRVADLLSAFPVADPDAQVEREILAGDTPNPANSPVGCKFHGRCPIAEEQCVETEPALREVREKHFVRCHLVV